MTTTRVLSQTCVARIVHAVGLDALLDELIERLDAAFCAHDPEHMETIARSGFRYTKPDLGLIEWMPTMETGRRVSIKVVGYHPTNPVERNSPSVLATTSLYDAVDGRLLALCEASFLTALRTGAASAVVTDVLAVKDASTLGMIGCGSQAVTQIHAISRVRPIDRVLVFDADTSVAESLRDRLGPLNINAVVEVVASAEEAMASADILCSATSADPGTGPVVSDGEHRPWLHVNAVGADHPEKFELPATLLRRAIVVPDLLEQCLVEGECQQLDKTELGPDLPQLLRRRALYESSRTELTVFDSTGWAFEDLIAAELLLDHAARLGEGVMLDLQPQPRDPYDPYEFICR